MDKQVLSNAIRFGYSKTNKTLGEISGIYFIDHLFAPLRSDGTGIKTDASDDNKAARLFFSPDNHVNRIALSVDILGYCNDGRKDTCGVLDRIENGDAYGMFGGISFKKAREYGYIKKGGMGCL